MIPKGFKINPKPNDDCAFISLSASSIIRSISGSVAARNEKRVKEMKRVCVGCINNDEKGRRRIHPKIGS